MLTAALVVAAFAAGLTGAWSPCGFSMVSTLGEHARGRAATLAACAAFVPGALVGGVLTFGLLAWLGSLLGGGDTALVVAAVLAGAAAVAEAAGVRIAPQIRRQVPEHWRRVLPLPVAAAGYGVLLGLGFTTFVLTFAVPALAGVALAVGDVSTGVLVGLAFAVGRSLPVVVLAPHAQAPLGLRATELMAERPSILRSFRAADALALAVCAFVLSTATAEAATRAFVDRAADPSVVGEALAWDGVDGGVLREPAGDTAIEGSSVAIGGAFAAALVEGEARVTERATGARRLSFGAEDADAVAVSDGYLALRRRSGRSERIEVVGLADGVARIVARTTRPAQLGRPALDGDRLVFHVAGRRESRIDEINLTTGQRLVLRRERRRAVANPSLLGEQLLYVETTPYQQALVLGARTERRGRSLLRIGPSVVGDKGYTTKHGPHRPGIPRPQRLPQDGPRGTTTTLWTTALAPAAAYVTRVRERSGRTSSALLRVGL